MEPVLIIFYLGLFIAVGVALIVVRIRNPWGSLIASLIYAVVMVPYAFGLETLGVDVNLDDAGKTLGVIVGVIAGSLISLALSEIRNNNLTRLSN